MAHVVAEAPRVVVAIGAVVAMFTSEEDDMPKASKNSSRSTQKGGAGKSRGSRSENGPASQGGNARPGNGRGRGGQSPGAVASGARRGGNGGSGGGGKRRLNPALARPVTPDDELSAIVGSKPLPRPQVVKKLWDYIKAEGLQDKQNKRMINADDKLRPVFRGRSKVNMFEMTKLVSEHLQ